MEFKMLKVCDLQEFAVREIRQEIVDKLKERIDKDGYNNSRPLSVVKKDNVYIIADGNHRYNAIKNMDIEVPCAVYDDDIYSLATRMNQDEDTYAPMDLFDWLGIIKFMKKEGYTLKKIGVMIGWSEQTTKYYSALNEKVSSVLDFCRVYQKGRETSKVSNETFNFTEGWFRTSGLYELDETYQLKFFEAFKKDKFKWNKAKVQAETAKLKLWQEFIEIAKEKLSNEDNLPDIIELIENNNFKNEGQLLIKINDLNKESANKLICGDALIELEKLEDCSIDLVVTDPPYGIDYSSNMSIYEDYITKGTIKNDGLEEALTLLDNTCKILKRKTKADAHLYFFTSWKVYSRFEKIIGSHFNIKNCIIWDKGNASMGDLEGSWGNKYEMIIFASKGNRKLNTRKFDVLNVPRIPTTKAIHPTQKPELLIKEILEASAQKADTVCDPFMGSGSTIKAVKNYEGLNYIGIEIDKNFFERAKGSINE